MSKLISVADDIYMKLKQLKSKDESFSDALRKLIHAQEKKDLMQFAGKWSGSKEETDRILKRLMKDREKPGRSVPSFD